MVLSEARELIVALALQRPKQFFEHREDHPAKNVGSILEPLSLEPPSSGKGRR